MSSSDLAKKSWQAVEKRFRNKELLSKVIAFVKSSDKEAICHASSSLEALSISTEHRHDSACDVLVLEEVSGDLNIRWYEKDKDYFEFKSKKHGLEKFKECFGIYCEKNSIG